MTATLFLGQNIRLGFKFRVGLDRARLTKNLTTLNCFAVDTAQQSANIVARFAAIQQLAEHFHARTRGRLCVLDTNDFNAISDINHATFDPTGHDCSAARDRKYVFHRHQERLVNRTLWRRNILINGGHQSFDRIFTNRLVTTFHRGQSGARNDWDVITRVVIRTQKFANFHFDKLKQLVVVDLIDFVHIDDHCGDTNLTAKQNVLARLWHWAVGCVHNKNCTVHLRGTGDHVLDIVSVAGAVDVSVVAAFGFVFYMRRRNRDSPCFFFRGTINLVIRLKIAKIFRNRSRQRCLAVVNVTNRANVYVRFVTFKLCFCHGSGSFFVLKRCVISRILRGVSAGPKAPWAYAYFA